MTRPNKQGFHPQGAYAAKQCPLRVQYDAFPPPGVERAEPSEMDQLRMADGNTFEDEIFTELQKTVAGTRRLNGRGEDLELATAAAMADGVPLILGGRLPTDHDEHRVGKPDVLVRAEQGPDQRWTYHPVDVKHHIAAEELAAGTSSKKPGCSTFAAPGYAAASPDAGFAPRRSRDDLLQLAHYHRMLEVLGHASATVAGGIIGKERVVAWHHLDEPTLQHTWNLGRDANQSPLERYDHEFTFRIDVLKAAVDGAPIVEPVATGECGACPWVEKCWPTIEAADSTSLLPRYGYKQWHALRRRGISSRAQLAALDERTAYLLQEVPALPALVAEGELAADLDPIADLASCPSPAKVAILNDHEVQTAADLRRLDRKVLELADAPGLGLLHAIRAARVITGDGRPVLRWGVNSLEVPSADAEIDIDMESALDGTPYLWGALVDDHYHGFASWGPSSPAVEADVFLQFWPWFQRQRAEAQSSGRSLIAYCWSRAAEAGALRLGALAAEAAGHPGLVAEVDDFLGSPDLVDLLVVFREQVVTGQGNGLKVVAPLAGFEWRDEDPGGEMSMLWHHEAVAAPESPEGAAARRRLLQYNEDDVRATAAIRAWMRSGAIVAAAPLGRQQRAPT